MKIGAIIQARSGSKRLPNKHFLKIKGKPIIYQLIKRLKRVNKIRKIVISTTKKKEDDKFEKTTLLNKINIFRGSEKDCLGRVYKTAVKFKFDVVVFITGDCPIFDIGVVKKLLEIFFKKNLDYAGNSFIRSYPDGMDAHIISIKTLEKIDKICNSKREREHVTLGIKRNSKKFKIYNLKAPRNLFWPSLALTLDVKKDFILIKKIIDHFYKQKKYYFSCKEVVQLLRKKRNWVKINSKIKRVSNFL